MQEDRPQSLSMQYCDRPFGSHVSQSFESPLCHSRDIQDKRSGRRQKDGLHPRQSINKVHYGIMGKLTIIAAALCPGDVRNGHSPEPLLDLEGI